MKNKSIIGILLVIIIVIVFISLNCSSPGTSKVTIHINLGLNKQTASNTFENSIFDRIFRFFSKDAKAQTTPPHITSLELNITGSGMENIHQNYTSPDIPASISLEVTSGPSRLFEVLASTGSATLRGAVTESLVGGTTVTIPITMGLYETKIILPDFTNNRIVQIDDLSQPLTSPNWKTVALASPYDIDFSSNGRIYIAVNIGATGGARIYSLDDITKTPSIIAAFTIDGGYVALCIDRRNTNTNQIYYATSSQIYRANLDGSGIKSDFIMTGISTIRGLNITNSGLLLVAYQNPSFQAAYSIYDPNAGNGTILSTAVVTDFGSSNDAWDIAEINSKIYIAHDDTGATYRFIREYNINASNQLVEGATYSTSLFGPHRFINTHSNKIYLINDFFSQDSLVVMSDITGVDRQNYGSNGIGIGTFDFYY